jgi:hypothetical protein
MQENATIRSGWLPDYATRAKLWTTVRCVNNLGGYGLLSAFGLQVASMKSWDSPSWKRQFYSGRSRAPAWRNAEASFVFAAHGLNGR